MESTNNDIEKASDVKAQQTPTKPSTEGSENTPSVAAVPKSSKLQQLNAFLCGLDGFEARGITRVLPEERQPSSVLDDIQVAVLWFSANISCNNLVVGLYGPLLFELGFLDSAMCAVFGAFLGSLSTAYMATWGPQSGNRTSKGFLCSRRMCWLLT